MQMAADKKTEVGYDGDVNGTNITDVNDAQYVYGIYNKKYTIDITKPDEMQQLLRADVNGDGFVDVEDAAAVIKLVLHPGTSDAGEKGSQES